jgi:cyclophilin family peptidyl-prolyl cis-trans isomerase
MRRAFLILSLALTLSVVWTALSFGQGRVRTIAPGEVGLRVEIEGRGNVVILLHSKEAPRTTNHILKLVRSGFYDEQRVHRVEKSPKPFLVQLGDPASKSGNLDSEAMGKGGSGTKIPYEETNYSNLVGAVGLAANPGDRNSGDSQFYMLLDNATFLDGNYTVFGQVISGMDVLRKVDRGDRIKAISVIGG